MYLFGFAAEFYYTESSLLRQQTLKLTIKGATYLFLLTELDGTDASFSSILRGRCRLQVYWEYTDQVS